MCWHLDEMHAQSGNNYIKVVPFKIRTPTSTGWKSRERRCARALTSPTEKVQGRKGEVDVKSNCRTGNKKRRHRKEFVTYVRVFAKLYNLQRGIMTEPRKLL